MDIKKPKFIRKYDFINYFLRNEDEWFWPLNKLVDYIDNKTKKLNPLYLKEDVDEELDQELEDDSYEYIRNDESTEIDPNDPKVYEGRLIDQKAKQFITDKFKNISNIIDFDQLNLSSENAFIKTKEILSKKNDFILFQPVFIYKNKAIAKPDAFIKCNNEFLLIETKGVTTNKRYHLIDITYQAIIINDYLKNNFNNKINDCFICVVKYEKCKKNNITFDLTNYASISSKSGNSGKSTDQEEIRREFKLAKKNGIRIIDCLYLPLSQLLELKTNKDGNPKKLFNEVCTNYKQKVIDDFDFIIDSLLTAKIINEPKLEPTLRYKDWIKDCEFWLNIRDYYINDVENNKHQLFKYSGYLIKFKDVFNKFYMQNKSNEDLLKSLGIFYDRVKNNIVYTKESKNKMKELKNKKVYFDFESINLATRVIDNTLPFMQTVNQVSIIIDNGESITQKTKCNNLLFDPIDLNINCFEKIIDAIIPNQTNLKMNEQFSYVVYNKSFEVTRLKEMEKLINKKEYSNKIQIIINNIFDLADLFDVRKEDFFICLKELNGFYSIKKVLPYVEKNYPEIYHRVGCKDYKKELKVQNGSEAQKLSSQRFFHILDNEKWNKIVPELKKYCENDVRAMVAVEYFIYELFNSKSN